MTAVRHTATHRSFCSRWFIAVILYTVCTCRPLSCQCYRTIMRRSRVLDAATSRYYIAITTSAASSTFPTSKTIARTCISIAWCITVTVITTCSRTRRCTAASIAVPSIRYLYRVRTTSCRRCSGTSIIIIARITCTT